MSNNDLLKSMTPEEKAAAIRFCATCEDGEGYDVPNAMMQRLAEIGLVKHRGGRRYVGTDLLLSIKDDLCGELRTFQQPDKTVDHFDDPKMLLREVIEKGQKSSGKEPLGDISIPSTSAVSANTNPNIRLNVAESEKNDGGMAWFVNGLAKQGKLNLSSKSAREIATDWYKQHFDTFIKTLSRPESIEAVGQIKKAVKEFRKTCDPLMGELPSLAQTYQLVAKALGFKTWEAMVAVAGQSVTVGKDSPPATPAPNNVVVDSSAQPDPLISNDHTVNDFLKALEKEPYLIDFGIRCSQHIDRNKSKEENFASFQTMRESFSSSGFKEFAVCCEWLSGCTKRKTINLSYSSYGLKHMVEAWMKRQGREDYYVSNGAFIAAAIHMGFDWKPDFDSPNVRFNISKKSPAILELKN